MKRFEQSRWPWMRRRYTFMLNNVLEVSIRTPFSLKEQRIALSAILPEPVAYQTENGWFVRLAMLSFGILLLAAFINWNWPEWLIGLPNSYLIRQILSLIGWGSLVLYWLSRQEGFAYFYRGGENLAFSVLKTADKRIGELMQMIRRQHYRAELQEVEKDAQGVRAGIERLKAVGIIDDATKRLYEARANEVFSELV